RETPASERWQLKRPQQDNRNYERTGAPLDGSESTPPSKRTTPRQSNSSLLRPPGGKRIRTAGPSRQGARDFPEGERAGVTGVVSRDVVFFMGDQRFESTFLQRGVSCELDFRRYGAVRYPEPEDGPWRLSAIGQG